MDAGRGACASLAGGENKQMSCAAYRRTTRSITKNKTQKGSRAFQPGRGGGSDGRKRERNPEGPGAGRSRARAAGAGAAQATGSEVRGEVLGSWGGRAGAGLTVALGEAAMLGPSGCHEGESTPHLPPTPTVLAREGIVSSR